MELNEIKQLARDTNNSDLYLAIIELCNYIEQIEVALLKLTELIGETPKETSTTKKKGK